VGKLFAKNLAKWNGKIEERVALTSKNLLQLKSIKMIGLENAVSEQIKKSRLKEIASFRILRIVIGVMHWFGTYPKKRLS
jgi:membrane carboxypeptidase/penicillin-binding protein